jgi:hypothetical protein
MAMLSKIGRLFRIETRFEAWVAIYVIALGAVERGQHYLAQYPGAGGWMLAAACTGVVFLAGAKLLDSVRPRPAIAAGPYRPQPVGRPRISGNPPTAGRWRSGSKSRLSFRTGSRPTRRPPAHRAVSPEDRTHTPHR